MQGALPLILQRTPEEFFQRTRDILQENVRLVCDRLSNVPGITPVEAHGAMYMMIKLDTRCFPAFAGNDLDFVQALITEESLYCLPGSAFYYPGAIRFVMTHSIESMMEACERLRAFCLRHYKSPALFSRCPQGHIALGKRRKSAKLAYPVPTPGKEKLDQVASEVLSTLNAARSSIEAQ